MFDCLIVSDLIIDFSAIVLVASLAIRIVSESIILHKSWSHEGRMSLLKLHHVRHTMVDLVVLSWGKYWSVPGAHLMKADVYLSWMEIMAVNHSLVDGFSWSVQATHTMVVHSSVVGVISVSNWVLSMLWVLACSSTETGITLETSPMVHASRLDELRMLVAWRGMEHVMAVLLLIECQESLTIFIIPCVINVAFSLMLVLLIGWDGVVRLIDKNEWIFRTRVAL